MNSLYVLTSILLLVTVSDVVIAGGRPNGSECDKDSQCKSRRCNTLPNSSLCRSQSYDAEVEEHLGAVGATIMELIEQDW